MFCFHSTSNNHLRIISKIILNNLLVIVAENETRSAELNPPSYQAGVRDGSRGMARDVSGNQAPHNITPVRQGAANSKAESKRLQWERERGTSTLTSYKLLIFVPHHDFKVTCYNLLLPFHYWQSIPKPISELIIFNIAKVS